LIISGKNMPFVIPTNKEASIKERKALSFTADIKTSNKTMLAINRSIDMEQNLKS